MKLALSNLTQSEEYGYRDLPLCILDAVFSIGVNYTSIENVVKRFCEHYGVTRLSEKELAPQSEQLSVSTFLQFHQDFTFQEMAEKIYQNKQRTSTRNGILKAEAAYLFAGVVQKFGVEYLQDVTKILGDEKFETEIARIRGQSSGLSTRYFYMLAGDDNFIKPDRMIRRFLQLAIGRELSMQECQKLLLTTYSEPVRDYPLLTPLNLDHEIWLSKRQAAVRVKHLTRLPAIDFKCKNNSDYTINSSRKVKCFTHTHTSPPLEPSLPSTRNRGSVMPGTTVRCTR